MGAQLNNYFEVFLMKFSLPSPSDFFSKFFRSLKQTTVAVICLVMLFSVSSPAYAFGSKTSSDPSDGVVQLDNILDEARDSINNGSMDMDEVQSKSRGGLNGVQGAADATKMKKPVKSDRVTSVKDDIENALETVMGD